MEDNKATSFALRALHYPQVHVPLEGRPESDSNITEMYPPGQYHSTEGAGSTMARGVSINGASEVSLAYSSRDDGVQLGWYDPNYHMAITPSAETNNEGLELDQILMLAAC
jgi:hypothetical protein